METSASQNVQLSAAAERQMRRPGRGCRKWPSAQPSDRPAVKLVPRTINYVAISRETGTDGSAVGRRVAEMLGWSDFGHNIREHVAQWYREPRLILDPVDETGGNWFYDLFGTWLDRKLITHDKFLTQVGRVIHILARRGPAVFVGRGAQFMLPRRRLLLCAWWRRRPIAPSGFSSGKTSPPAARPAAGSAARMPAAGTSSAGTSITTSPIRTCTTW